MAHDENIQVFCRNRPTAHKPVLYAVSEQEIRNQAAPQPMITFQVPHAVAVRGSYLAKQEFMFSGIFDQTASQRDVFDRACRKVVLSALDGVNGTLMCYGQTGSGKTYTMSGGRRAFRERGVIPRALHLIYQQIEKRTDCSFHVHIQYMEIYNECGYDLLEDPQFEVDGQAAVSKVVVMEDEHSGVVRMENLSVHPAPSEEEASRLLFVGESNRIISETSMNKTSSRSHCIFTIMFEIKPLVGDQTRLLRSKLHFVDLAGSERVHKTAATGTLLREAGYINKSLHFLEQVIVALHEKAARRRDHIPYRNSLMTKVLKDSLGGNHLTVMIATLSVEESNFEETLSTCRFAQRVAQIHNKVKVNEETDPYVMIERLNAENRILKEQLAKPREEETKEKLGPNERATLLEIVRAYLADPDLEVALPINNMSRARVCFRYFKDAVLEEREKAAQSAGLPTADNEEQKATLQWMRRKNRKLVQLVKALQADRKASQRRMQACPHCSGAGVVASTSAETAGVGGDDDGDFEADSVRVQIAGTNVSEMLERAESRAASAAFARPLRGLDTGQSVRASRARSSEYEDANSSPPGTATTTTAPAASDARARTTQPAHSPPARSATPIGAADSAAFEEFCKTSPQNSVIVENRAQLKLKYVQAIKLGNDLKAVMATINYLKSRIEEIREAIENGQQPDSDGTSWTERLKIARTELETSTHAYQEIFAEMKQTKQSIDHMRHVLEVNRAELKQEFELWYAAQNETTSASATASQQAPKRAPRLRDSDNDNTNNSDEKDQLTKPSRTSAAPPPPPRRSSSSSRSKPPTAPPANDASNAATPTRRRNAKQTDHAVDDDEPEPSSSPTRNTTLSASWSTAAAAGGLGEGTTPDSWSRDASPLFEFPERNGSRSGTADTQRRVREAADRVTVRARLPPISDPFALAQEIPTNSGVMYERRAAAVSRDSVSATERSAEAPRRRSSRKA
eukprot:gnl/Spiro4/27543_TR13695_c0_g1_i1.p1 gnl/Spiro4/27543_TR13695_c0_g1~~gnl/Spiro4/27543_TR13695_c0_g1_i1.p1  ORF type:complete len:972 (-),score=289.94 gnl/Spiro4/27543_TR13695_c0_g1_i1:84-2999(-)